MARFARVIAVDVAHHVTQRGNARRFILDCDADREVYLNLLWEDVGLRGVSLVGYCLMSNHVHLIAIPHRSDDLSLALRHTHGRYASYWNARHRSSGHVWQGRYYSCPLDPPHLWKALRYTELNPVRAGLVREAKLWKWSSAAVHCGVLSGDDCLAEELWHSQWTAEQWEGYLTLGETELDIAEIRQCTHTGRPLGTEEFIVSLEKSSNRRLTPLKGGDRERQLRGQNKGTSRGEKQFRLCNSERSICPRVSQTDYAGVMEQTCSGLPFGDSLDCSASIQFPTEHHFTGKERDVESGLDYFGARYYSSNTGRFMSPDWAAKASPVPYATFGNPQSLNLYNYMRNNPLGGVDQDGHCDWCQKLWNGIAGNGFQTNAQLAAANVPTTITMTEEYTAGTNPEPESDAEPRGPNEAVALSADGASLLSATPGVIPGSPALRWD